MLLPQERGRKGSTVAENQACYHCLYCRDRKGEDRSAVAGWGPPFTPNSNRCPGYLFSPAGHCRCEPGFPGLTHCAAVTACHPVPMLPVPSTRPAWGTFSTVRSPRELWAGICSTSALGGKTPSTPLQKAWLISNI